MIFWQKIPLPQRSVCNITSRWQGRTAWQLQGYPKGGEQAMPCLSLPSPSTAAVCIGVPSQETSYLTLALPEAWMLSSIAFTAGCNGECCLANYKLISEVLPSVQQHLFQRFCIPEHRRGRWRFLSISVGPLPLFWFPECFHNGRWSRSRWLLVKHCQCLLSDA